MNRLSLIWGRVSTYFTIVDFLHSYLSRDKDEN
jgi:hypothetical protein